ncbi:hypothetical protein CC78DRAFT_576959 [Lojkania enalia]|uniref:Uncharacterized protein n=1 Tax=Lojkania enalia TaxID=147567 RepID=A0A9P4N6J9_9PLEO|nr:hypothetical protein CC78DRAFT_576959 [Didymosphaeria enalia]
MRGALESGSKRRLLEPHCQWYVDVTGLRWGITEISSAAIATSNLRGGCEVTGKRRETLVGIIGIAGLALAHEGMLKVEDFHDVGAAFNRPEFEGEKRYLLEAMKENQCYSVVFRPREAGYVSLLLSR